MDIQTDGIGSSLPFLCDPRRSDDFLRAFKYNLGASLDYIFSAAADFALGIGSRFVETLGRFWGLIWLTESIVRPWDVSKGQVEDGVAAALLAGGHVLFQHSTCIRKARVFVSLPIS